jgi:tRNA threonylcarbamoyladenosine biosynthesis protein TsaE
MSNTSNVDSFQQRMASIQETIEFGTRLGRQFTGGEVVALTGELGTGKTVITRGIALGLGIPADQVSSPTFTLIQEYAGSIPLIHADLYRLDKPSEISTLGLEEYFLPSMVVVIEWADRFPHILPFDHIAIRLEYGETEDIRLVLIQGTGDRSLQVIANLQKN